jgi:hypothetical protein
MSKEAELKAWKRLRNDRNCTSGLGQRQRGGFLSRTKDMAKIMM